MESVFSKEEVLESEHTFRTEVHRFLPLKKVKEKKKVWVPEQNQGSCTSSSNAKEQQKWIGVLPMGKSLLHDWACFGSFVLSRGVARIRMYIESVQFPESNDEKNDHRVHAPFVTVSTPGHIHSGVAVQPLCGQGTLASAEFQRVLWMNMPHLQPSICDRGASSTLTEVDRDEAGVETVTPSPPIITLPHAYASGADTVTHEQATAAAAAAAQSVSQIDELSVQTLRDACRKSAKERDWEGVVSHGMALLTQCPDDYATLWWVGSALCRLHRDRDALGYLERAVALVCNDDGMTRQRRTRAEKHSDGAAATVSSSDNQHHGQLSQHSQQPHDRRHRGQPADINIARMKAVLRECRGRLGEIPSLYKFPRTAHLFDAGGTAVTVDDLVMSSVDLASFIGEWH